MHRLASIGPMALDVLLKFKKCYLNAANSRLLDCARMSAGRGMISKLGTIGSTLQNLGVCVYGQFVIRI